jgi:hypothetical protein
MEHNATTPDPLCTDEMLAAFACNEGDATARSLVERALSDVSTGPATLTRLQAIRSALAGLDTLGHTSALFAVTPVQRDTLASLMGERTSGVNAMIDAAGQALREVIATLTFDSARAAPAMGYRGGAQGARLLRAQAEGITIDLRVEDAEIGDGATISGQVLPEPDKSHAPGPMVWLQRVVATCRQTGVQVIVPGESDGYFEVEVGAGVHDLRFEVGGRVVVVQGVGGDTEESA